MTQEELAEVITETKEKIHALARKLGMGKESNTTNLIILGAALVQLEGQKYPDGYTGGSRN